MIEGVHSKFHLRMGATGSKESHPRHEVRLNILQSHLVDDGQGLIKLARSPTGINDGSVSSAVNMASSMSMTKL